MPFKRIFTKTKKSSKMRKTCTKNDCTNLRFGGGFCTFHQYLRTDKKQNKISQMSDKEKLRLKDYKILRDTYMSERFFCEVCKKNKGTDLHHVAGRLGDNLTNVENFMSVCRDCHIWIHEHPRESREKGFLI